MADEDFDALFGAREQEAGDSGAAATTIDVGEGKNEDATAAKAEGAAAAGNKNAPKMSDGGGDDEGDGSNSDEGDESSDDDDVTFVLESSDKKNEADNNNKYVVLPGSSEAVQMAPAAKKAAQEVAGDEKVDAEVDANQGEVVVAQAPQAPHPFGLPFPNNNVIAIDLDAFGDDKPWTKPGADLTDYFNFGFDEDTWRYYCMKQIHSRKIQRGRMPPPPRRGPPPSDKKVNGIFRLHSSPGPPRASSPHSYVIAFSDRAAKLRLLTDAVLLFVGPTALRAAHQAVVAPAARDSAAVVGLSLIHI